jgi:SAM-dependent methyltransferase
VGTAGRYPGSMGFYREHVLPRLVDRACGTAGLRKWRAELSTGLSGRVVEIGFGSGLNVDHYPSTVEKVFAVEPSATAFRIAQKRIGGSPVAVELVGLDGQSIPLPDDSCDDALCTFALCTIPDADAALAEVRRVLRPGGRFHFLEHGLAPDPGVAAWQRRIEPFQCRLADGCHLTRDPVSLVRGAGFVLDDVDQRYGVGPKPWSWFTRGVAVNPE